LTRPHCQKEPVFSILSAVAQSLSGQLSVGKIGVFGFKKGGNTGNDGGGKAGAADRFIAAAFGGS